MYYPLFWTYCVYLPLASPTWSFPFVLVYSRFDLNVEHSADLRTGYIIFSSLAIWTPVYLSVAHLQPYRTTGVTAKTRSTTHRDHKYVMYILYMYLRTRLGGCHAKTHNLVNNILYHAYYEYGNKNWRILYTENGIQNNVIYWIHHSKRSVWCAHKIVCVFSICKNPELYISTMTSIPLNWARRTSLYITHECLLKQFDIAARHHCVYDHYSNALSNIAGNRFFFLN